MHIQSENVTLFVLGVVFLLLFLFCRSDQSKFEKVTQGTMVMIIFAEIRLFLNIQNYFGV